jgi:hypothetical protein
VEATGGTRSPSFVGDYGGQAGLDSLQVQACPEVTLHLQAVANTTGLNRRNSSEQDESNALEQRGKIICEANNSQGEWFIRSSESAFVAFILFVANPLLLRPSVCGPFVRFV